ncbi:MAG: CocE/NonD family hydrolase [Alphaproteobacteria bacterium]|nr:CocE/NonD family hydrolase [Alphaproteobacteria bacterium]
MRTGLIVAGLCALLSASALAASDYNESPKKVVRPESSFDYVRRVEEIPMRDGVTLHTVILIPKGASRAPMLLTRTPYNAEEQTGYAQSGHMGLVIDGYDNAVDTIIEGGYIRVVQDVRGKYGSKGIYMMNPPLAGTKYNPTKTDDSTDAYDTIDWLVKHVKESNGKVGILGISYDGFLPLMALVNPHPALKISVPMNPMVDGWRGDDWFHNGAFRQQGMPYIYEQDGTADNSAKWWQSVQDDYDFYMRGVSAGALGEEHGLTQMGFWNKIVAHPAYDDFWQSQAMDKVLADRPLTVPVLLVGSLWDAEDIYGYMAMWKALKPKDTSGDMVRMSIGPWYHGQGIEEGSSLGAVKFGMDTAKWWRRHVLAPVLAHYLKDEAPPLNIAPVTAFETGTNEWRNFQSWPVTEAKPTPIYLKPGGALGFEPTPGAAATVDYVSDPMKPVPFRARPIKTSGYDTCAQWACWLTDDQREASGRTDVISFTTDVLTQPVTVRGQPVVHLTAATTGSDADWVVKLIDVYPDQVPGDHAMGGYQLAVAMDIFRGRYRESLSEAKPIAAGTPLPYSFELPTADHVFLPGHRIMVQVQSSWFPLYDRNPQTFVPNIFFAKPGDFRKATQSITVAGPEQSRIDLPIAP